jgi:acyl-CoA dehydrogenase
MSKLKAGEVAVAVTEKAVQILGGAGYLREHPVERWYRDAKIYTIFEGQVRSSGSSSRARSRAAHIA